MGKKKNKKQQGAVNSGNQGPRPTGPESAGPKPYAPWQPVEEARPAGHNSAGPRPYAPWQPIEEATLRPTGPKSARPYVPWQPVERANAMMPQGSQRSLLGSYTGADPMSFEPRGPAPYRPRGIEPRGALFGRLPGPKTYEPIGPSSSFRSRFDEYPSAPVNRPNPYDQLSDRIGPPGPPRAVEHAPSAEPESEPKPFPRAPKPVDDEEIEERIIEVTKNIRPSVCSVCERRVPNLLVHANVHHLPWFVYAPSACPVCMMQCNDRRHLSWHQDTEHPEEDVKMQPGLWRACLKEFMITLTERLGISLNDLPRYVQENGLSNVVYKPNEADLPYYDDPEFSHLPPFDPVRPRSLRDCSHWRIILRLISKTGVDTGKHLVRSLYPRDGYIYLPSLGNQPVGKQAANQKPPIQRGTEVSTQDVPQTRPVASPSKQVSDMTKNVDSLVGQLQLAIGKGDIDPKLLPPEVRTMLDDIVKVKPSSGPAVSMVKADAEKGQREAKRPYQGDKYGGQDQQNLYEKRRAFEDRGQPASFQRETEYPHSSRNPASFQRGIPRSLLNPNQEMGAYGGEASLHPDTGNQGFDAYSGSSIPMETGPSSQMETGPSFQMQTKKVAENGPMLKTAKKGIPASEVIQKEPLPPSDEPAPAVQASASLLPPGLADQLKTLSEGMAVLTQAVMTLSNIKK